MGNEWFKFGELLSLSRPKLVPLYSTALVAIHDFFNGLTFSCNVKRNKGYFKLFKNTV